MLGTIVLTDLFNGGCSQDSSPGEQDENCDGSEGRVTQTPHEEEVEDEVEDGSLVSEGSQRYPGPVLLTGPDRRAATDTLGGGDEMCWWSEQQSGHLA